MIMKRSILTLTIAALFSMTSPARAAIQLVTVVSGLSDPLFVGHAGDGTNRLFIVERGGIIRVLQPGSSSPTVFLDIHTKVATAGGEQGLLGLAFHPNYAINRRFFVYYSRAGDGTEVIAEYAASMSNPDVADPGEKVLLTIPHPMFMNHNGGMLAFAPDGNPFLYIGVGDGGGGFDSQFNNAQNTEVLLGKMLRIDVDHPDTVSGTLYSSPASNPFVGRPGRDEIFAYGFRNPWRFSFDRLTGQQWVGDVGQGGAPYGAREEVDTPIMAGGNYGWRVFEGDQCTGQDPALCGNPADYLFPVFQYDHSLSGRCSITGGYVYRGTMGAVASGTYVYGDYCSGEIFAWANNTQSVILDTSLNISSFGEDEAGELYVVGLGGTVSRIAPTGPPPPPTCAYTISPAKAAFGASGGAGSVTVTTSAGCPWTATRNVAWITITSGASGSGNGTVTYSVEPYSGKPRNRNGSAAIAGQAFSVKQSR